MEHDFESLISGFIKDNIGISKDFLSIELSNHLKQNLQALMKQNLMKAAGTGNSEIISHDKAVRSDSIYWLDRKHNNEYENEFFDQIDDFIKYLNRSCFAGINCPHSRHSFHMDL